MTDPETGASPEQPHLSFKNKASEKFFDRTFPLQSADQTQQKLREKVYALIGEWNESLNKDAAFTCPEGFDVMWVGAKDWNELKDTVTCSQCHSPVKYAQSHCSACSTAKPHFILTIKETETRLQFLDTVIDDQETMPKVLPEGCRYSPVGVGSAAELHAYRNCLYCGAPVLMTFPSCTHCGMSKPYLELTKTDTEKEDEWQVSDMKITYKQHQTPSYFQGTQINVPADYDLGVCRAADLDVAERASVVAASAIDVTMAAGSKAHEIAAKHLVVGKNVSIHTVTVYDGGRLILDSSAQINELFLGSGVSVEIRGVLKPEIFQKIRELFSTKKQGRRIHVECEMPDGMRQKYQKD